MPSTEKRWWKVWAEPLLAPTRQAWEVRICLVVVLLSSLLLATHHDPAGPTTKAVAVGLLLVASFLLLRRLFNVLVGPVFYYDLIRTARRQHYLVIRCVYAVSLLGALFMVYYSWFGSGAGLAGVEDSVGNPSVAFGEMPRFASSFFNAFLTFQLSAVLVLTPAYTAGAIAEEKERRTLEFLLTTELTDYEIVLGKLATRVANIGLVVWTGLPILGFLQFLGGVDPNLVLAGFVITGVTAVVAGGLSILHSVLARNSLTAVVLTYFWIVLYLVCCWCVPGVNFSNPFVAFLHLPGMTDFGPMAALYLGVEGLVVAFFCAYAVWNLRRHAFPRPTLVRTYHRPRRESRRRRPVLSLLPGNPHHPIGDNPLMWRELYVEPESAGNIWRSLLTFYGLAVVLICGFIFFFIFLGSILSGEFAVGLGNGFVRIAGTTAACLMCVSIAASAAGRISREREQRTLDNLLTLPVDLNDILYAKWFGSLATMRHFGLLVLGLIWLFGVISTGLHLIAVPLLAVGLLIYACFSASVGLWCSAKSKTTLQATFRTMLFLFLLVVLTWLLAGYGPPLVAHWFGTAVARRIETFVWYGLAPPMPLWVLAFHYGDFLNQGYSEPEKVLCAMCGLALYAGAALLFWELAKARFRAESGPGPEPRKVPPALPS